MWFKWPRLYWWVSSFIEVEFYLLSSYIPATSCVISCVCLPWQPSITQYGRSAISQNEMASLCNYDIFSVPRYGQTETFYYPFMSLEYKCGSAPGSSDIFILHRPSLHCALAAMALSKHTLYYRFSSYGCRDLDWDLDPGWMQALARVLLADQTPHWSSSVRGRASKKRKKKK